MKNTENNNSIVEELEPSTETVNAEALLNEIEQFISDHAILPEGASTAITLWCLASYSINSFRIFPKLIITSPEKRCGKSTVLDLIESHANKALITSHITPASIFRIIEKYQPTLLIDEADTFIKNRNDDMVGIINSGHAKNRARVIRSTGADYKPEVFSTWSPMVLASIRDLQSTTMDRSIVIQLKRKKPSESVARLSHDLMEAKKENREKLLKWSLDNKAIIKDNMVIPENINDNDRAVDNWIPLFSIANQISTSWYSKCKSAYELLTIVDIEQVQSTELLSNISDIYKESGNNKIRSASLVKKLEEMEDKPWKEYKNGKPINQVSLANMLRPYGIKPKGIRFGKITPKGYELEQFKDSFDRYLFPE